MTGCTVTGEATMRQTFPADPGWTFDRSDREVHIQARAMQIDRLARVITDRYQVGAKCPDDPTQLHAQLRESEARDA